MLHTEYAARKALDLKHNFGILPKIEKKSNGKTLLPETIALIKEFYEDDEYTRMCPGAKEFKSIYRWHQSKKNNRILLLLSITELSNEFQKKYPNIKVGLSKFFELRPKWIVTASDSVMYVCACEIHQNVKLMTNSIL